MGPHVLGTRHLHRPRHLVRARGRDPPHTRGERVLGQRRGRRAQHRRASPDPGRPPLVAVYTSAYTSASSRPGSRRSPWRTASTTASPGPGTRATPCSTPARRTSATRRSSGTAARTGAGSWSPWRPWTARSSSTAPRTCSTGPCESTFGPAHAVGGVWECPDLFPLVAPRHRGDEVGPRGQPQPGRHRRWVGHPVLHRTLRRLRLHPRPARPAPPTRPTTTGWTTGATTTRRPRSTTPRTAVG